MTQQPPDGRTAGSAVERRVLVTLQKTEGVREQIFEVGGRTKRLSMLMTVTPGPDTLHISIHRKCALGEAHFAEVLRVLTAAVNGKEVTIEEGPLRCTKVYVGAAVVLVVKGDTIPLTDMEKVAREAELKRMATDEIAALSKATDAPNQLADKGLSHHGDASKSAALRKARVERRAERGKHY